MPLCDDVKYLVESALDSYHDEDTASASDWMLYAQKAIADYPTLFGSLEEHSRAIGLYNSAISQIDIVD